MRMIYSLEGVNRHVILKGDREVVNYANIDSVVIVKVCSFLVNRHWSNQIM